MRNRSVSRIVRGALLCSALVVVGGLLGCASAARESRRAGFNLSGNPVHAPVEPPSGLIFTQYKAPLDFSFSKNGVGTPVSGNKSGTSEAQYLSIPFTYRLISFGWGDASIETAQKNAGLSEVSYADYQVLSVLGVYTSTKVTAHGK